jgi:hypothetical protein
MDYNQNSGGILWLEDRLAIPKQTEILRLKELRERAMQIVFLPSWSQFRASKDCENGRVCHAGV